MKSLEGMKKDRAKLVEDEQKIQAKIKELDHKIENENMHQIYQAAIKHHITSAEELVKVLNEREKENKSIIALSNGGNANANKEE